MHTRKIGPFEVSALGLGCMNLSHAYGTPPEPAVAAGPLLQALELGHTFFDTAALYGFGANETPVGNTPAGVLWHDGRLLVADMGTDYLADVDPADGGSRKHLLPAPSFERSVRS